MVPDRIAHYRVTSKLGEGAMGIVYAAEDPRLGRQVAIKVLRADVDDAGTRARFQREARAVAGISHPTICQVFDVGEWEGRPFLVMELLRGEPLSARLGGPVPPDQAIRWALTICEALGVLHRHAIMHRDLKPSNIFITASGLKLLDFGLARPLGTTETDATVLMTQAGVVVGTPRYAAPEQLSGEPVDARADIFSLGVILFEMVAARSPFSGTTLPALIHAVLYDTAPVLTGSPAISALDRVVHRALSKKPEDRYATIGQMSSGLEQVLASLDGSGSVEARTVTRLAVLPFRLLKPDPEIEYLRSSLADAITTSLSGLESLVIRSTLRSSQFAEPTPDLNRIASELAVDAVLTGSILPSNGRLRVSAQLMSVPAGDVLWSYATIVGVDAVFELHESLAGRTVEALPLTSRDHARKSSARPASAKAFELYLRGMQLRMETSSWRQARVLFDQSVALDPAFAPAWAERGRLDRVFGKYENQARLDDAEAAFQRALELDPDSGAAHYYYAQLEIDLGRAPAALVRLLDRARKRRAEPLVWAALVHACRYCGLLDESIVAHGHARRLDPTVSTSVLHTYYMRGDYVRALEEGHHSSDPFETRVLGAMGRDAEAIAAGRREEERFGAFPLLKGFCTAGRAAIEGRRDEALVALAEFGRSGFNDGEGLFYLAGIYSKLGLLAEGLGMLEGSVDRGFVAVSAIKNDPYLSALRHGDRYRILVERASLRQRAAADGFHRAGGATLLPT